MISVQKGEFVDLVAYLTRVVLSAALENDALGVPFAVIQPHQNRVINVAVSEGGDEELPQGGRAFLMRRRLRKEEVSLQDVRRKASCSARFPECIGDGAVQVCAQASEGDLHG